MKVYRLERNGLGPFTQEIESDPFRSRVGRVMGEKIQWKKGDNKECFIYGFDDKTKAKDYFGEELFFELLGVGFKLKEHCTKQKRIRHSPTKKELAFHSGNTDDAATLRVRRAYNYVSYKDSNNQ